MKTCDYTYRNDGARSSRPAPIYGLSGTISRPPARGSTVERNEKKGGSVIEALDPEGGGGERCTGRNEIYPDAIRGNEKQRIPFRLAHRIGGGGGGDRVKDGNGISIRFGWHGNR